jgi:hypothetical protein
MIMNRLKAFWNLLLGMVCLFLQALTHAQPSFPVQALEDDAGFEQIFDGKTLEGWDGDPVYWRVENGCILGEITPETVVDRNTFLIWRRDITEDFELKVEYRVSAEGNSGIGYRCEEVPGVPWALRGYQSDIDGKGEWNGQNYEERGRTFLALRGQVCRVESGQKPKVIGSVGEKDALQQFVNQGWNEVHLIVRGNVMIHMVNGHVMSIVVDDDTENRKMKGLLGVQVHVGPPMTIEYRNFRYKKL